MIELTPMYVVRGDVIIREGGNTTVDHIAFSQAENLWMIFPKEYPTVPFRYDSSTILKVKRT